MPQYDDLDAPEALLTPSEVAALFRVNPKTVTRWARSKPRSKAVAMLPAPMNPIR